MFGNKIKVSDELWEKITLAVKVRGASSVEELVQRILESEIDKILREAGKAPVSDKDVEDIAAKLKGLGYLD